MVGRPGLTESRRHHLPDYLMHRRISSVKVGVGATCITSWYGTTPPSPLASRDEIMQGLAAELRAAFIGSKDRVDRPKPL